MAFNVGLSTKDAFKQLKKLTPAQRLETVKQDDFSTLFSALTPAQFAELFPDYYRKGLPDVSGFRDAISKKSRQKQDDINFGLSQGARSIEEAERMGGWRRRGGGDGEGSSSTTFGRAGVAGSYKAANYVAILKQAGFSDKDAKLMAAVGMQESNGNIRAANDKNPSRERSYGLFQININAHDFNTPEMRYAGVNSVEDLYDPVKNAKVAYYLYYKTPTGIRHWGGYTDGGYKKYLSAAEAAADTPAGIPSVSGPAGGEGVSSVSSRSGGFYGDNQQCVALSKHFSGLGAASGWKVKSGNITAGSVIATMSYNDGSGGRMARDMPDGRSHYHTGIALTAPNSNGDVLILEQFAGQPARVRSININNYNGERWGVVEGGEPNAGTLKAVEIGKELANPDQLAWIQSSTGPAQTVSEQGEGTSTADVKPTLEAAVAKPTLSTNQQPPQYPEQQQKPVTQTAKVEKTDKSKKTYETYKFDADKYYNEVNTKHPEAKFFGYDKEKIMKETYQGFEEAQAAGAIKWNRKTNEIQVLDPNHEAIQKIYKDMQDQNIDRNAFLTQTEAGGSGRAKVHKKKTVSMAKEEPYEGFMPDLRPDVGMITGQFESGKFGEEAAKRGVETISTGKGDKGGISYGRHQLASKTGTMQEFLNSDEGKPFRDAFGKTKPGSPKFNAVYERIARENPEAFDKAQHEFLARTHYTPFLKSAGKLGFDINDPRIQESVWGGGVQFRNNMRHILKKAEHSVGKSVEEQVTAIAKAKQEMAPKIKHRYEPEAQAILGKTPGGGYEKANVMDMSKYASYVDEQKSKKATFIAKNTPRPETQTEQVAKSFNPYKPTASAEVAPHSHTPAKEVFERMRNMKAEPEMPPGVYTAPEETTPKDKQSFNMQPATPNKMQQSVTIDKFLERSNPQFPTPSLERAMMNTMDPSGASYGHFGGTKIG